MALVPMPPATFWNSAECWGAVHRFRAWPMHSIFTDLAGTDTDITGGPSTGTAAGGAINFWISTPGASSAVVNSGTKRAFIDAQGWHPPAVTFAVLSAAPYSTAPDGSVVFCTDCNNFTDDTTGTFDSVAASGGTRHHGAERERGLAGTLTSVTLVCDR